MKIGNWYKVHPAFMKGDYGESNTSKLTGRCVYIHPRGRFGMLEFSNGVRECFPADELQD